MRFRPIRANGVIDGVARELAYHSPKYDLVARALKGEQGLSFLGGEVLATDDAPLLALVAQLVALVLARVVAEVSEQVARIQCVKAINIHAVSYEVLKLTTVKVRPNRFDPERANEPGNELAAGALSVRLFALDRRSALVWRQFVPPFVTGALWGRPPTAGGPPLAASESYTRGVHILTGKVADCVDMRGSASLDLIAKDGSGVWELPTKSNAEAVENRSPFVH